MGPPSLVNFDIFLLHGVAASLRALPMSQSSVPPPSVAPGPDFFLDLYEENEFKTPEDDGAGITQRLPRTPVPLLRPLADQGETLSK